MRRALPLLALVAGCTYYNAMWSAERFAKDARRLEADGREPEARAQWARAAVKAESALARHPGSRWADDALVLRGEGMARAGMCVLAAAPIAKALATVSDAPLRERAALAAADCALAGGRPVEAEQALTGPLASNDARRRSRAEYLAGRAAAVRLEYETAVLHFRASREPGALRARADALIAAGRIVEASAMLDTIAAATATETEWAELLAALADEGGAPAASAALDRMLTRGRLPFAAGARLMIADGDRLLVAGAPEPAAARYQAAIAAAPGSVEAGTARLRVQRAAAARATSRAELALVVAELRRVTQLDPRVGTGGGARGVLALLTQIADTPTTPGAGFRAAELARDSLAALRLAGRLFLDLAAADPGSLFAPKALLAALTLLPDRHDSIVGVLETTYAGSPYTRALHGEAPLAYAAAEDSLARELGLRLTVTSLRGDARDATLPLRTGPRGPWLEEAPEPARPRAAKPSAAAERRERQ
ncbi:MAG TPA: hypothetical protein VGJ83_08540 [Gemmatimonadales bacterium]